MKYLALALILIALPLGLIGRFCDAQSAPKSVNLSHFSFDQLEACFDDHTICGSADIYEIEAEFIRRLPTMPTDRLLACFDDWKICGVGEGQASGWPISDELARRGHTHEFLARYWTESKWTIRGGIEHVAYHFDTPEVTQFMRKVMVQRIEDGEDRYWPVNYLAKKCDPIALKELSSGRYRNQGCMQYQTSVELFGKCRYRPAIPYLVDTAVFDFCGNITDAAGGSLRALFPRSPADFKSLDAMQRYYCRRAKQDGLQVQCEVR